MTASSEFGDKASLPSEYSFALGRIALGLRQMLEHGFTVHSDQLSAGPWRSSLSSALREFAPYRMFVRRDPRGNAVAVYCNETGMAVFQMLQHRRNERCAFLYALDLLQLNGRDLRREPVETSKVEVACYRLPSLTSSSNVRL